MTKLNCGEYLKYPIQIIDEDVHQWRNVEGIDILHEFYKDPKTNAFGEQLVILFSNFTRLLHATKEQHISAFPKVNVTCRSLESVMNVFIPVFLQRNYITDVQAKVLGFCIQMCYQHIEKPHLIIYIRTRPDLCLERLKCRGEYEDIDIDYLTEIHHEHERWFDATSFEEGKVIALPQQKQNRHVCFVDGFVSQADLTDKVHSILIEFIKQKTLNDVQKLHDDVTRMQSEPQPATLYSTFDNISRDHKEHVPPELLVMLDNIKKSQQGDDLGQGLTAGKIWNRMACNMTPD